jgi:hypothetical protein
MWPLWLVGGVKRCCTKPEPSITGCGGCFSKLIIQAAIYYLIWRQSSMSSYALIMEGQVHDVDSTGSNKKMTSCNHGVLAYHVNSLKMMVATNEIRWDMNWVVEKFTTIKCVVHADVNLLDKYSSHLVTCPHFKNLSVIFQLCCSLLLEYKEGKLLSEFEITQ